MYVQQPGGMHVIERLEGKDKQSRHDRQYGKGSRGVSEEV